MDNWLQSIQYYSISYDIYMPKPAGKIARYFHSCTTGFYPTRSLCHLILGVPQKMIATAHVSPEDMVSFPIFKSVSLKDRDAIAGGFVFFESWPVLADGNGASSAPPSRSNMNKNGYGSNKNPSCRTTDFMVSPQF